MEKPGKLPSSFKNIHRYNFCKENNKFLLKFLNESEEKKNYKCCDWKTYNFFNEVFPLSDELRKELTTCEIIDITLSDNEDEAGKKEFKEYTHIDPVNIHEESNTAHLDETTVEDIIFSIKETLETDKIIPISVVNNLQTANINLEDIFSMLSDQLNHEEVVNLGKSFKASAISNELIINYYFKYLLIKEINTEYSDEILSIMNDFVMKYQDVSKEEISQFMLNMESTPTKIVLQYLDNLNADFKAKLFKFFIFKCITFKECHIGMVEILLSNQTDYECLSRLVDLLSNCASNMSSAKSFGKLVIHIIQILGKNVHLLEQSLKHIISSHKSIWKSKMLETFQESMQDSFSMTQSFRY